MSFEGLDTPPPLPSEIFLPDPLIGAAKGLMEQLAGVAGGAAEPISIHQEPLPGGEARESAAFTLFDPTDAAAREDWLSALVSSVEKKGDCGCGSEKMKGKPDGGTYSLMSEEPPPEEEVIVVIGKRPRAADEYDPGTGGDPGTGTSGGGENPVGGGTRGSETEQECADREAMEAANELKNDEYEDVKSESTSLIYVASDGSIQHTPVISTHTDHIPYDVYDAILKENGISWSQVIGMLHNHPTSYGFDDRSRDINRYPSGDQTYVDGDWGFGKYATDRGASSNLSIYVLDTQGMLREFNWADRDFYASLTRDQKDDGVGLPGEVEGCAST